MRVDRFLQARLPDLSFARIQRAIRKGEVRVDGKRVDANDRLEPGQIVRIPPLRMASAPSVCARALSEISSFGPVPTQEFAAALWPFC